jgi:hypothetical protein
MAETVCAACGERWYPHEAVTNRLVAEAARWPGIGLAIRKAVWPDDPPTTCLECGDLLTFSASGVDADWHLACAAKHNARHAENKPRGAPAHWSKARAEHYERALSEGVIIKTDGWPGVPPAWHEHGHQWTDQCWACERVKGTAGKLCRLAIPQVVLYRLDTGMPCTLVTDRGDATAIYQSLPFFGIAPDAVPVRTVPQVLNSLAAALRSLSLSSYQRHVLEDIATRLWWRSPWERSREIYAPARALVRTTAYGCAWGYCAAAQRGLGRGEPA